MFLRAKTHTFFSVFSSSKVARLEVQVRAPSPVDHCLNLGSDKDCLDSISVLFADAGEGVEDFFGDADEADDPPKDPPPRPSLIQCVSSQFVL